MNDSQVLCRQLDLVSPVCCLSNKSTLGDQLVRIYVAGAMTYLTHRAVLHSPEVTVKMLNSYRNDVIKDGLSDIHLGYDVDRYMCCTEL